MMQDNVVSMSIIMSLFIFIIMLALGIPKVTEMAAGTNWLIYTLLTAFSFAVYITVILTGVRMFVGELASSYQGISEKLLKDSVVGIDCPAVFPFSPNAWMIGFIFATVGQVIAMVTLFLIKSPVLVLAGFIPLFFDGGTVAVFANKHGGVKAAIIFALVNGLIAVFGTALVMPMTDFELGWMGMSDWSTVWPAITLALRGIGNILGLPVPPYGV